MESPYGKYELSFEEYQNLVEQFNNLVKEKGFKPLYYKDYRKIAGKHLNGIVSKLVFCYLLGGNEYYVFYRYYYSHISFRRLCLSNCFYGFLE